MQGRQMGKITEFAATLVDPIDRENMVQLRSMLISSLVLIERACGLPPSVLTREQRRKLESWMGATVEDVLEDKVDVF